MVDVSSTPAAAVATHKRTIGIIHPPPHIRNIVDKTCQFVAMKGPDFERMILAAGNNNAKLNFLNASDPYHAYYQHRLSEFLRAQSAAYSSSSSSAAAVVDDVQEEQFRRPSFPGPNPYTIPVPKGITDEEVDIIRLTAQFIARNGITFLNALIDREKSNPLFHFLFKPATHSMFDFFRRLTDAYSKVLMTDKLEASVSVADVLERCLNRLDWERSQEQARQKKKAEDEIEQERMLQIDWHDFVVVESIDFLAADDDDEDLPPPMTLEQVMSRAANNHNDQDEDDKKHEMMRIVNKWKRPELDRRLPAADAAAEYVVSPITGELIPINEMSQHMRISLIHPIFKEEQKDRRMFAKIKETTLAENDEICRNIAGLARTRPDIFGTTEEEVSNAVKQPKQVIWEPEPKRQKLDQLGSLKGQVLEMTVQSLSETAAGWGDTATFKQTDQVHQ